MRSDIGVVFAQQSHLANVRVLTSHMLADDAEAGFLTDDAEAGFLFFFIALPFLFDFLADDATSLLFLFDFLEAGFLFDFMPRRVSAVKWALEKRETEPPGNEHIDDIKWLDVST